VAELFTLSLFHVEFWRAVAHDMRPLFWPYFVGSLLGAVLVSALSYYLTLGFLEARKHHHLLEVRRKGRP
jgi:hypothetical protein